jgi:phosphoribosylamine-glycine ligase
MMMDFDLVQLFLMTIDKRLSAFKMKWKKGSAINVVLTSGGYPSSFQTNKLITIKNNPLIFYAGSQLVNGDLLTTGGRVLSVMNYAANLKTAINNVYRSIKNVHFDNMHYRKDIGS